MTYEEFLNKVNLLDQQEYIEYLSSVGIYAYGELLSRLFNNNFHRYDGVDKTVLTDLNKRIILFKWEVGGSSGGSSGGSTSSPSPPAGGLGGCSEDEEEEGEEGTSTFDQSCVGYSIITSYFLVALY
jgi:hypothetical protein